jgi:hypothetical protein
MIQTKTMATHTILYNQHKYIVKCDREEHCGYSRVTVYMDGVLNADTGNPIQYPQRTQVIDGKSVTTYFPIRESFIQHIRSHMTDQEHAFVMRAAERHFANL